MQSSREEKNIGASTTSEADSLRETVDHLIRARIQNIISRIEANNPRHGDYTEHLLLTRMHAILPHKKKDDLLADLIFLQNQQDHDVSFVDHGETKSQEQAVGPAPVSEDLARLSAIPEESSNYSPEERQRHFLLNQAHINIPKLAILLDKSLDKYTDFIRTQKQHIQQLSLVELRKYVVDLKTRVEVELTTKNQKEEKEREARKIKFLEVANILINQLTSLQPKSTQEKEAFRFEQQMLLEVISENMADVKDYIQGLHVQISELQGDTPGQRLPGVEGAEVESKEMDPANWPSPEASPAVRRRTSSSGNSSQNFSSPEVSPRNPGSSSDQSLARSMTRFPFVASFSAPLPSPNSATTSLTVEIPFSPTSQTPRRGSTPGGSAPS